MSRTPSITQDQILKAARAVFLEKGIRATTAEVARRAGVAEGSVFKRFKTKDQLFLACMDLDVDEVPWVRTLRERAGQPDVQGTLIAAGMQAIEFFRALMPLVMMSWSNQSAGGLPLHMAGPNPPPVRAIMATTRFFEEAIRQGHVRRQNARIMARVFVASVWHFVFFELFLGEQKELALPAKKYLSGVVRLLLFDERTDKVTPAPAAGRPRRRKGK